MARSGVLDTHVHILSPDQGRYPRQIPAEVPALFGWTRCDFSAESLLAAMDRAGIGSALLVQTYNAYRSDNRYVADMADKYSERFRFVCVQDPSEEGAEEKLTHWVRERGAAMVRIMLQDADLSLDDERVVRLLACADTLRIPVCVFIWFAQIGKVAPMLERFPELKLALDHMASPPIEEGPPYANLRPLIELSRFPNLYLKFSSSTILRSMQGRSTSEAWFSRVIEAYGAHRLMWGSNFPMNNERDIAGLFTLAREQLAFLPEASQRALFGENGEDFLR